MLRCYSSRWEPGSPGAVASLSRGSRSTATGLSSSTTTTTMWVVALFKLAHHFTQSMLSLFRPTCQVSRWTMWQTTKSAYQRAGTPPSSGLQPPLSVLCRCQTFKDNIHSSLRLAMVLETCKILSKLFVVVDFNVTWDFHVQRTSTLLSTQVFPQIIRKYLLEFLLTSWGATGSLNFLDKTQSSIHLTKDLLKGV